MPTIVANNSNGGGADRINCHINGTNNGGGVMINCTNGSGSVGGSNNGSGGSNNCGNNIGNNNIYENDSNLDERQCMLNGSMNCDSLDRHSDCCSSSKDDHDGADTCCSCSESSCLYAEAGDPSMHHQVQIIQMASQTAN